MNKYELAEKYLKENHTTENTTDFQNAMNIAVLKAYIRAVDDIVFSIHNIITDSYDDKEIVNKIQSFMLKLNN